MRTYLATIYYNGTIHVQRIKAKNLVEANSAALKIGYQLTGYGEAGFLEHVSVKRVTE